MLRRALHGMRMAVNVRVSDFLGIALRTDDDVQMLALVHRDPSLTIPLCVTSDEEEITTAWQLWCDILKLPCWRRSLPNRHQDDAVTVRSGPGVRSF